jgi:hypothetical protein
MNSVFIAGATRILGEEQKEYEGLPVQDVRVEFGVGGQLMQAPAIRSEWQPTTAELELLNSGGSVYLVVLGTSSPAVMLTVEKASSSVK